MQRFDQASLRSLNPERIRVPVTLSALFGEENVASRPGAAQIERYRQFGLVADNSGNPGSIGDAVHAFAASYDDDGVRSGFAETRKNQIDVEQGCGKVERWFRRLLLGAAKSPVVGEIHRPVDDGGGLLPD